MYLLFQWFFSDLWVVNFTPSDFKINRISMQVGSNMNFAGISSSRNSNCPLFSNPSSTCMLVNLDITSIDEHPLLIKFASSFKKICPQIFLRPSIKSIIGSRPESKLFRNIPPRSRVLTKSTTLHHRMQFLFSIIRTNFNLSHFCGNYRYVCPCLWGPTPSAHHKILYWSNQTFGSSEFLLRPA